LINGRKLQYEVPNASALEEEGFVTLIRYNAHAPQGKATALFNWKVSAMEIHPEEDVVLVLLLCTATMRSVADFGGKHHGNLFAQRRHKESKPGLKDWGSVVVDHATSQSNLASWYLNTPQLREAEDGTERILSHAGPMGGACGSSCQAGADMGGYSKEQRHSAGPVPASQENIAYYNNLHRPARFQFYLKQSFSSLLNPSLAVFSFGTSLEAHTNKSQLCL
jgi:hypothetical protein